MKYLLIAVKDLAVQAFQPVENTRAKGQAVRGFMDAINNPNNKQLHDHPEDFELYHVGNFDDETGLIEPLATPELMMRGKEAKNV